MPIGLLHIIYTWFCCFLCTVLPRTFTVSVYAILVPCSTRTLFTVTNPCAIKESASLREQKPISLKYLFIRTNVFMFCTKCLWYVHTYFAYKGTCNIYFLI